MFIAFEGLDGSGSSTQSKLLSEKLENEGFSTFLTKEPTSHHFIGQLIREVLQHKRNVDPKTLQLLFTADRSEHLKNDIEPALAEGKIVISDRYLLSTIAFGALDCDMNWLMDLNKPFLMPDITFLSKLEADICIQRIQARGTQFELFEKKEKLEKIWKHYEILAQKFPNVQIIDTSDTIEAVAEKIWEIAKKSNS